MTKRAGIYKTLSDEVRRQVRERHADRLPDIAGTVRRLREAKKISAAEVCRRSGELDPRTLNALEKGRIRNPTLKTLQALAQGLGLSMTEILSAAEGGAEPDFFAGGPQGAFHLDFPRQGLKIVSLTPLIHDFFCGKLILSPKVKIPDSMLNTPFPVYLSVLVGGMDVEIRGRGVTSMKEGDNIFLRGSLRHSLQNRSQRETAVLLLTAPSFLK